MNRKEQFEQWFNRYNDAQSFAKDHLAERQGTTQMLDLRQEIVEAGSLVAEVFEAYLNYRILKDANIPAPVLQYPLKDADSTMAILSMLSELDFDTFIIPGSRNPMEDIFCAQACGCTLKSATAYPTLSKDVHWGVLIKMPVEMGVKK